MSKLKAIAAAAGMLVGTNIQSFNISELDNENRFAPTQVEFVKFSEDALDGHNGVCSNNNCRSFE